MKYFKEEMLGKMKLELTPQGIQLSVTSALPSENIGDADDISEYEIEIMKEMLARYRPAQVVLL